LYYKYLIGPKLYNNEALLVEFHPRPDGTAAPQRAAQEFFKTSGAESMQSFLGLGVGVFKLKTFQHEWSQLTGA
jgi:hypothetical protein